MKHYCKRCLIELDEERYEEMLERSMAAIPSGDRADEALREQRVGVCQGCEFFTAAVCRACGCYVELRSLKKNARCPYKKW